MTARSYARNPVPTGVGVGPRTAQFLRRWYEDQPAKVLAYDLRISPSKAKDLLNGISVGPHVEQLAAMFGAPFVRFVFQDAAGRAESIDRLARVEAEIQRIEAELAWLHADRDSAFLRRSLETGTKNHAGVGARLIGTLGEILAALASLALGSRDRGSRPAHRDREPSPPARPSLAVHPGWAAGVSPLIEALLMGEGVAA